MNPLYYKYVIIWEQDHYNMRMIIHTENAFSSHRPFMWLPKTNFSYFILKVQCVTKLSIY